MNEVLELSCRGQQTSTNSLPRGHHLDPAPARAQLSFPSPAATPLAEELTQEPDTWSHIVPAQV